jgi:hypothetical protein
MRKLILAAVAGTAFALAGDTFMACPQCKKCARRLHEKLCGGCQKMNIVGGKHD